MHDDDTKRENRLRRLARKHDLLVQKSRSRTPEHPGWGTYRLVDPYINNAIVEGGYVNGYGMTLDDIEEAVRERI